MGQLPSEVVQTWKELKAQYGTGLSVRESGLFLVLEASVISGALVLDEAFYGLDILEENQDPVYPAEQLMDLSLFCPDSRLEESDREEGTSRRRFSHLANKKSASGDSMLLRVQGHRQQSTAASSSDENVVVGEDQHGLHAGV